MIPDLPDMPDMPDMASQPGVIVVGAGLAGLAAAVTLAEAGKPCLLLEREAEAGGLARSLVLDGLTFDYGPHVLFREDTPGGRLLLDALADEPVISRPFAFAIQADGRNFVFPNHFDALRYPWRYKRQILAGLLGRRRDLGDSAADELSAKTGQDLYELLFAGMLRKKTGLSGDKLHRHWLTRPNRTVRGEIEPRPGRSRIAALANILSRLRRRYVYPAGGFGRLPELLLARFTRAGGRTILGCGPIGLRREADRIAAVTVDGQSFQASHVIWTAPLTGLLQVLGREAEPGPRFEDALLVFAAYDCPNPPRRPYVYVYHPAPDVVFNRCYYPASLFRERGPAGREGLCLEITPGAVSGASSRLSRLSADALVRRAVADVERLGIHPASRLREVKSLLLPGCLPVYGLDYAARMERARRELSGLTNLVSVGRLGGWHFCMSAEAADQGIKAARFALGRADGGDR